MKEAASVLSCFAIVAFTACGGGASRVARCGDGVVDTGEGCDDGNTTDADGCSTACQAEVCGNGTVDPGELCDDGNVADGDGCSATCASDESCGNGVVDTAVGEGCDDGNTMDADGCSSACRRIIQLATGDLHACALRDDGSVKCWGWNSRGQLGLGDTADRGDEPGEMGAALPLVDLGTGRRALALTAGAHHTCALLDDGSVKCWGRNSEGQLGLGDTANRGDEPGEMGDALPAVDLGTGRTAVALAAGGIHTCALLDGGAIKCWGHNQGQLGLGDVEWRGDEPGEMGDALPAVDLGTGRTAVALAGGGRRTCALLDDGGVKCWGTNALGELGIGDTNGRGDGPGEMGDALPAIALGTGRTATALALGQGHTCALLDDGTVKCWGINGIGELGLGDSVNRGGSAGDMGDHLPAVDLGSGRTAQALETNLDHTCVLLDDETTKCWGNNFSGAVGLGEMVYWGNDPGEMGASLPVVDLGSGRTAQALATGFAFSCALLDDATLKCWGTGSNGELGLGDMTNRGDEPGEMGDALPVVDLGP